MIHIPEIQEQGSIFQVVQKFYQDTMMRQQFNYPCVTMPRLLFGSVDQAGSERAKELLQPYVVADTNITNASSVSLSLSLELPGRTASK
jgi:hypothetical protein